MLARKLRRCSAGGGRGRRRRRVQVDAEAKVEARARDGRNATLGAARVRERGPGVGEIVGSTTFAR